MLFSGGTGPIKWCFVPCLGLPVKDKFLLPLVFRRWTILLWTLFMSNMSFISSLSSGCRKTKYWSSFDGPAPSGKKKIRTVWCSRKTKARRPSDIGWEYSMSFFSLSCGLTPLSTTRTILAHCGETILNRGSRKHLWKSPDGPPT